MSLPIDRTAKSTLDNNLVNGNTSDAPAVKNSNDVVYNTIDELNAKVDGLVTTGTLSQSSVTPVANKIAQRDANGNVVSALPVSNGQNPNILFNPSWRMGSNGWTGIAANGFGTSFGSFGEGGILFNNSSIGSVGQGVNSSRIPIGASQQVSLQVEMASTGITAGSMATSLLFYNVSDVLVGRIDLGIANGLGYTKQTGTGTTPAGTTYMVATCYLNANTTNTNAIWKKLKVEIGSVATTFSDDNTLNIQQYGSALGLAQILGGGFKIQSNNISIAATAAANTLSATVTFPTAFSAAPLIISSVGAVGSQLNGTFTQPTAVTATTTQFYVYSTIAQNVQVNWIAIGT